MSEEVTVTIPLAHLDLYIRLLNEAAEDLAGQVDREHPYRDKYPSELRRYNRDMDLVNRIRAALAPKETPHG